MLILSWLKVYCVRYLIVESHKYRRSHYCWHDTSDLWEMQFKHSNGSLSQLYYRSDQNLAYSCLKRATGANTQDKLFLEWNCGENESSWGSKSEWVKESREAGEEADELRRSFSVLSCLGAQCAARNMFSSCDHRTGQLWVTLQQKETVQYQLSLL